MLGENVRKTVGGKGGKLGSENHQAGGSRPGEVTSRKFACVMWGMITSLSVGKIGSGGEDEDVCDKSSQICDCGKPLEINTRRLFRLKRGSARAGMEILDNGSRPNERDSVSIPEKRS